MDTYYKLHKNGAVVEIPTEYAYEQIEFDNPSHYDRYHMVMRVVYANNKQMQDIGKILSTGVGFFLFTPNQKWYKRAAVFMVMICRLAKFVWKQNR